MYHTMRNTILLKNQHFNFVQEYSNDDIVADKDAKSLLSIQRSWIT